MRRWLAGLFILLLGALPAFAQTNTPTPTGTPTTMPSNTPFATYAWPTLTEVPALSLTPKPWPTPTPPIKGTAFVAPVMPTFPPAPTPVNEHASKITWINDTNVTLLVVYVALLIVAFWLYLYINVPVLLLAGRVVVILVLIWRLSLRLAKRMKQMRSE